jgi:hypothetical protein
LIVHRQQGHRLLLMIFTYQRAFPLDKNPRRGQFYRAAFAAIQSFATRKGDTAMSQPFSRFLHPFDAHHPSLEPEVKRAILATWASDRSAVRHHPTLRKPPGASQAAPVDEILAAMRSRDDGAPPRASAQ